MPQNETSLQLKPGTRYRFEQEVWFDNHLYGVDESYPNGGEVEIRRGNDGQYWNGTTWQVSQVWVATVIDASGVFHYYDFTLPTDLGLGATLNIQMRVTNDVLTHHLCTITMDATGMFAAGPWRQRL